MTASMTLAFLLMMMVQPYNSDGREAVKGTEFIVAYMQHKVSDTYSSSNQDLFLTISNPTSSTVQAWTYNSNDQALRYVNVFSQSTRSWVVSNTVMLDGATKQLKYAYIASDGDLQVQAHLQYVDGSTSKSSGGMTVLPTASLGKNYLVATHCETGNCIIVVLSLKNNVKVKVKLRIGSGGTAQYNGQNYTDGQQFTEQLDYLYSMQIFCFKCDLTGTWIDSNKTVAVFSGGESTTVMGLGGGDLVMEQMMPRKSYGRKYVLGSAAPATKEIVKIVPQDAGDRFFYDNNCYESQGPRQVFTFERNSSVLAQVIAEKPVLVAQFVIGENGVPDAVLNLPVPVYQWVSSYQVDVPGVYVSNGDEALYVNVVAVNNAVSNLQVFGSVWDLVTTTSSNQGDYRLVTMNFKSYADFLTISCADGLPCPQFWGYVSRSKISRAWSVTLRDQINDFQSANTDATEVADACNSVETTTTMAETTTAQNGIITESPTATSGTGVDVTTMTDVTTGADVTTPGHVSTTNAGAVATTAAPTAAPLVRVNITCCPCVKNPPPSSENVTQEEKEKITEELVTVIKTKLTEDKKQLSSYVRTKESSPDDRQSSKMVAMVGVALFVLVFGFIIGLDVINFVRYVMECRDRQLEKRKRRKST